MNTLSDDELSEVLINTLVYEIDQFYEITDLLSYLLLGKVNGYFLKTIIEDDQVEFEQLQKRVQESKNFRDAVIEMLKMHSDDLLEQKLEDFNYETY